jgi:hypothetical protein
MLAVQKPSTKAAKTKEEPHSPKRLRAVSVMWPVNSSDNSAGISGRISQQELEQQQ